MPKPTTEDLIAKMQVDLAQEAINATAWMSYPGNRLKEITDKLFKTVVPINESQKANGGGLGLTPDDPRYVDWVIARLALYKLQELLYISMKGGRDVKGKTEGHVMAATGSHQPHDLHGN